MKARSQLPIILVLFTLFLIPSFFVNTIHMDPIKDDIVERIAVNEKVIAGEWLDGVSENRIQ